MHSDNHALLVIDVQNDFCPGGALAVPGGDEIVAPINALMDNYKTVVVTQDWHPTGHKSFASSHDGKSPMEVIDMPYGPQVLWPDHCVQNTKGADLHAVLRDGGNIIIRKGTNPEIDSYSAFFENDHETPTGLHGYLKEKGIDTLTIVGLATDFCVNYSAIDAANLGYKVTVSLDHCRAIDFDGSLSAAIDAMKGAGVTVE